MLKKDIIKINILSISVTLLSLIIFYILIRTINLPYNSFKSFIFFLGYLIIVIAVILVLNHYFSKRFFRSLYKTLSLLNELCPSDLKKRINIYNEAEYEKILHNVIKEVKKIFLDGRILLKQIDRVLNRNQENFKTIQNTLIDMINKISYINNYSNYQNKEVGHSSQIILKILGVVEEIAQKKGDYKSLVQETCFIINNTLSSIEGVSNLSISTLQKSHKLKSFADEGINRLYNYMEVIKGALMSSKKINDIIQSVAEIVEKSNTLSINSAIEAARLGEKGKGFDVISKEIKQLSIKTAHAINQIEEIIIEEKDNINTGIKYSEYAQNTLSFIMQELSESAELIEKIKIFTTEQVDSGIYISEVLNKLELMFDDINNAINNQIENSATIKNDLANLSNISNNIQSLANNQIEVNNEFAKIIEQLKNDVGADSETNKSEARTLSSLIENFTTIIQQLNINDYFDLSLDNKIGDRRKSRRLVFIENASLIEKKTQISFPIIIINISRGGILFETELNLNSIDDYSIHFKLNLKEYCISGLKFNRKTDQQIVCEFLETEQDIINEIFELLEAIEINEESSLSD